MTNQKKPSRNLTMLTDFYEITMSNGYFSNGYRDTVVYFDMFFRHISTDDGTNSTGLIQTMAALLSWPAYNS